MSYFLSKLLEANARIKLYEREDHAMAEIEEEEVKQASGEALVKMQLGRVQTKISNIEERLKDEQDEALTAIDEAMLAGAKAEQESLETWLNNR